MKIALLTLVLHINYGGILQAYALQTVLQRMGHQVEHLQPYFKFIPHPAWKLPLVWVKRFLKKCITCDWRYPVFTFPYKLIRKNTDAFIDKHINIRPITDEQWNKFPVDEYDAYIAGSDQIWRAAYALPIQRYFFSFLNASNVPRISYAASFGLDKCDFTDEQVKVCTPLLRRFKAVSVRESSGVDICKTLFGVDALQMLDPTMLLDKNDYLSLTGNCKKSKGNLLSYILDETAVTDKFLAEVACKTGLKPFRVNSNVGNEKLKITERQQPPVEMWLQGFADAEFVVTDSFHACVFAIIFNKPFVCIGNKDRGMSRFNSLFTQFGLSNCLISPEGEFVAPAFDWNDINSRLEKLRADSFAFIENSLKN